MAKENELQFWQGLEADRLMQTPAQGEPLWTTDTKKLYIGDGSTAGGLLQGSNKYHSSFTYKKDDIVGYEGFAYVALQDIPIPEAWDSSHWKDVTTIARNAGVFNGRIDFDQVSGLYINKVQAGPLHFSIGPNPVIGSRQLLKLQISEPDKLVWDLGFEGDLKFEKDHEYNLEFSYVNGEVWVTKLADRRLKAFITKWKTTTVNEKIVLPLRSGDYEYNFDVNWGDGNHNLITVYDQPEAEHQYAAPGEHIVTITGTMETWNFGNGMNKFPEIVKSPAILAMGRSNAALLAFQTVLDSSQNNINAKKLIDIMQWGDVGFTDCSYMFYSAGLIKVSALDSGNFIKVSDISCMFSACDRLISFVAGSWEFATNCKLNARSMFNFCKKLTSVDISAIHGFSEVDINHMFSNAPELTTILHGKALNYTPRMEYLAYKAPKLHTCDLSKAGNNKLSNGSIFSPAFPTDISEWLLHINAVPTLGITINLSGCVFTPAMYEKYFSRYGSLYVYLLYDIELNMGGAKYTPATKITRDNLINKRRWTILDGGPV